MRRLALAAIAAAAAATDAATDAATPLAIGAPAAAARALALTDDGAIAVSADLRGHVRLWPSVDGKREPVVVAANAPVALAITRDGDDVAIAGLDAAGGIELIRTSRAGVAESRATLDAGRPAVALVAAGDRVIAQRDDGELALFDLHGARTALLVAAPGERVDQVAARHGRALALIASDAGMRGRWIDLPAARWGDDTPALPIAPGPAALSPDLRHLAATAPPRPGLGARVVVVDLATGKATAHPTRADLQASDSVVPDGYLDEGTLALALDGESVDWWTNGGARGTPLDLRGGFAHDPPSRLAVADDVAIASMHSDLVIATPRSTQYLGYRLTEPTYVRAVRGGLIVSDGQSLVRTDTHLRQRRVLPAPRFDASNPPSVIPIDAHHALTTTGPWRNRSINQVDLDHPERSVAVATLTDDLLAYEPSSRVAAWIDGQTLRFAHVGRDGALAAPAGLALGPKHDSLVLLDPSRAGGEVAIVVEGYNPRTITPVTGFTDGGAVTTASPFPDPDNTLLWQIEKGDLRPLGFSEHAGRRSPDGALTAEVDGPRIILRDHGAERWTIAVAGARDVLWTGSGDLIAIGDGLARIDLASGALAERQCGWEFGLHDEHGGSGGEICDLP